MATQSTELFEGPTNQGPDLRITPGGPGSLPVKRFASGSGTIAAGTPVAVVTASGYLAPWDAGNSPAGTNVIEGILWPNDVTLSASGEVQAPVMINGAAHIDDLVLHDDETLVGLKAAVLSSQCREKGLNIYGYEEFV